MKNKGFTIVEMILYMGFLSGFLLVLTRMLSTSLEIQTEAEATTSVHQDGRFILAKLSYDLGNTDTLVTPNVTGQTTNSLVFTIVPTKYTYALSNGTLTRQDAFGTNALNSVNTTVTNFSVTRREGTGSKPTLSVSFTLQSVAKKIPGADIQTFQTTIGIR